VDINSIQAYPPQIWWNKIATEKQSRLETGGEGETLKQMTDSVEPLYDKRGHDVAVHHTSKVNIKV